MSDVCINNYYDIKIDSHFKYFFLEKEATE